jgi:hypothetical protein
MYCIIFVFQIVGNLMVIICTKIGITNHDEYSLVSKNNASFCMKNITSPLKNKKIF